MKKISIVTLGTRGDLQPFILLAKYLKASGNWQPIIVSTNNYEEWIRREGIDFAPISGKYINIEAELNRDIVREALVSGDLAKFMEVLKETDEEIEAGFEAIEKACLDADLLLSSSIPSVKVGLIGEKLGKPTCIWLTFPEHATRKFSHPMVPGPDFPLWNGLSHKLMDLFLWKLNKPILKKYRKRFGLPPIRSAREYRRWINTFPAFNAFSPTVVPPCPDWPANLTSGGFVVDTTKAQKELNSDLLAHINKEQDPSPVIYMGFGSMPVAASPVFQNFIEELYKELCAQKKTYRILLFTGQCTPHSESLSVKLPANTNSDGTKPNFFAISSAPHSVLFPLCDFVLHHGGAGTTAAALYSGTPSASIPVCCDQIFWTKRTRKIMNIPLKSSWMTFQTMTPKKVIKLIEVGLTRRAEAQQIAQQLRTQEDGLASALEWLNQIQIQK